MVKSPESRESNMPPHYQKITKNWKPSLLTRTSLSKPSSST